VYETACFLPSPAFPKAGAMSEFTSLYFLISAGMPINIFRAAQ
jgi:hypothetical protein